MSKYYIPDAEEFFIGFEFEWFMSGKWQQEVYTDGFFKSFEEYTLQGEITEKEIRVKYLDQEDIHEIGFKYHDQYRDGGTSVFKKDGLEIVFYGTNRMTPSHKVIIRDDKSGLFLGNILNKSELKRQINKVQNERSNK